MTAGALFTNSLLRAISGEKGIVEPTFVKSPLYESKGVEFFASNVTLGVSFQFFFSKLLKIECLRL
jgi:malate dehydrogenase